MNDKERIEALEMQVTRMSHQIEMLQDIHEIRCLQRKYGYYIDKCLYDEAVALFAENCEMHFLGGIYRGKQGVHRIYCGHFREHFVGGKNGPMFGFLLDHPMMQDIVDVAPDRKSAKARLRCMMMAGRHKSIGGEKSQWWEGAIYENQYVRESGLWKIQVLNYHPVWHADFESGWAHTRPHYVPFYTEADIFPKNPVGPDELEDPPPTLWPNTDIFPFHYPHPITGKIVT